MALRFDLLPHPAAQLPPSTWRICSLWQFDPVLNKRAAALILMVGYLLAHVLKTGYHLLAVACCLFGRLATLGPLTWCIRNEMIRRRYNGIPRNGNNANQMRSRALCG